MSLAAPIPHWRAVHGILLLDKPPGISSNQALQQARRIFRAAKAGHTGSLDPLATGLLPLCFGEATKIAGWLLGARKAYRAEVQLGITTTTADADGQPLTMRSVPPLNVAALEAALNPLRGRIVQVPPIYSALKQGGVPLYKRARRGEIVQALPREVDVFRLDLIEHAHDRLVLEVECGSGTYVRSLAVDLGEWLGCGAHLRALRRLWVEPFHAPVMFTLEQLQALADQDETFLGTALLPLDAGLVALPAIQLNPDEARRFGQGQALALRVSPGPCRVYGENRLLAIGEVDLAGVLRVRRGLNPSV